MTLDPLARRQLLEDLEGIGLKGLLDRTPSISGARAVSTSRKGERLLEIVGDALGVRLP